MAKSILFRSSAADFHTQPTALAQLAEIEKLLGEKLIAADALQHEITATLWEADREFWQRFVASIAIGLLIGSIIGLRLVVFAAR